MVNQFVWFFGPSKVGKKSIIEELCTDNTQSRLKSELELLDKIKANRLSLEIKGGDQDRVRIDCLTKSILEDRDPNTATLIKGQTCDLSAYLPRSLKKELINEDHVIVFMWADPSELKKRLDNEGIENIDPLVEIKIQFEYMKKLREEGFKLVCVDNTDFTSPSTIPLNRIYARLGS